MDIKLDKHIKNKIKGALVFFLFVLYSSCTKNSSITNFEIRYKENKADFVSFNSTIEDYDIYLKGSSIELLGKKYSDNTKHSFMPLIPFSHGEVYQIRHKNEILKEFEVKKIVTSEAPQIIDIYPTTVTVPQNLLKFYIKFSHPMQAIGHSSEFIKIKDLTLGKEQNIFLELENELWDKDRTLLTLWLDPGRIKKDLIPNKEQGLPLIEGHDYKMIISENWRSFEGISLKKSYEKMFSATQLDTKMPDIKYWKLNAPKINTMNALNIEFEDVFDAQLLLETIAIYTENEELISGDLQLGNNERSVSLYPEEPWKGGKYILKVESRLEDLAGNNLNRLFDTDLKVNNTSISEPTSFKTRLFFVEK